MTAIYQNNAPNLYEMGLNPLPIRHDKRPCLRWRKWQKSRMSELTLDRLRNRFSDSNIGFPTGQISGLTIVDVDDDNYLDSVFSKFGEPKVLVRTPRGTGYHCYFKFSGEHSKVRIEGIPIDVRAEGGFIIAPPSQDERGKYEFVKGSWYDLENLTAVKSADILSSGESEVYRRIEQGNRNSSLFLHLKDTVSDNDTFHELMQQASAFNLQCSPPLTHAELDRTARSVWRLKEQGRIYRKGDNYVTINLAELDLAKQHPSAFALLAILKKAHWDRSAFAISPKAMASTLNGWGVHKIRAARETLLNTGYLELVHQGGRYEGDASYYRFRS